MTRDNWIGIFAADHQGSNFRSYVISIDMGLQEYWTTNIHWNNQEKEICFFTQYNPKPFCKDEACLHWPRSLWEDVHLDWNGDTLWTQVEAMELPG